MKILPCLVSVVKGSSNTGACRVRSNFSLWADLVLSMIALAYVQLCMCALKLIMFRITVEEYFLAPKIGRG